MAGYKSAIMVLSILVGLYLTLIKSNNMLKDGQGARARLRAHYAINLPT